LTVFNGVGASLAVWTMIHPSVVQTPSVLLALYYFSYALGGPGFSVPMGLFMAGVSVPCAFLRLLPKWVIVLGMILAVTGELSWFHLVSPKTLFLIPLVRFPGFIWLIAVGSHCQKLARPQSTSLLCDPRRNNSDNERISGNPNPGGRESPKMLHG